MLGVVVTALVATTAAAKVPRWQTLPLPPPMPQAVTTGMADAKDVKIYYATYGKGSPVILLHGGLGNGDHWSFQVPELAKKHHVIVIDSRNQGRSTFSKTKLTYHLMATDVLAVMDTLGIKSAAIVGWSDGGAIALDLAVTNPDRVKKLFVYGTNYDDKGSKKRTGPSATFNQYAAKCKHDYDKMAKDYKQYAAVIASLQPMWNGQAGFTKDQLRSIKAPTVISDGDNDEIVLLDQIKEMAQLVPKAKLVIFKDTSHFALWQDPDTFTQAILEFLAAK